MARVPMPNIAEGVSIRISVPEAFSGLEAFTPGLNVEVKAVNDDKASTWLEP